MTKLLSRSEILKADDLPTKDVEVPEWGGTVRVRSMTAAARDALEEAYRQARRDGEPVSLRALYAQACIVDENGNPVFVEADIEALGKKSADALDRVYEAIVSLNKLAPEHVEEAAKN